MGGSWHTGLEAHVFDKPVADLVEQILDTGTILTHKDYEFFATQPPQVSKLVKLLDLKPGMKVLEPSAGDGALAMAAAEVVGRENVTCYELMPENCNKLRALGFQVLEPTDFLQVRPDPSFARAIMNPPFSSGRDVAHVRHALEFLAPGGVLGAITSCHWTFSSDQGSTAFRALVEDHAIANLDIGAGAFKAAGTDVATKLIVLPAPVAADAGESNPTQPPGAPVAPKAKHGAVDTFTMDLFA